MEIIEIAEKLGRLLNGQTIHFDLKSYDDESTLPCIIDNEKVLVVESALLSNDGQTLEVDFKDGTNMRYDIQPNDDECNELGIYQLLKDMYMETDYSCEIGDFEQDFLGLPWWELSN